MRATITSQILKNTLLKNKMLTKMLTDLWPMKTGRVRWYPHQFLHFLHLLHSLEDISGLLSLGADSIISFYIKTNVSMHAVLQINICCILLSHKAYKRNSNCSNENQTISQNNF